MTTLTCAGPRTIEDVAVEYPVCMDGRTDRRVTVVRDCGHAYEWSGLEEMALPQAGEPALGCLGPVDATFERAPGQPVQPAYFDLRKRPVKHRKPRKDEQ